MIEILLTRGMVALVDDLDAGMVAHRWSAKVNPSGLVHAQRTLTAKERALRQGPRNVYLHREVLGPIPSGTEVDHINGNGLDCRRANLRLATKSQNAQNVGRRPQNSSGYRGVSRIRRVKNGREVNLRKPWLAQIQAHGKYEYLGLYASPEDAAEAWNSAALVLHGEFARLNIIPRGAL
jgi:hypothetical protein